MHTTEEVRSAILEIVFADEWDVGCGWSLFDLHYSLQQDEDTEDISVLDILKAINSMILEGSAVVTGMEEHMEGIITYTPEFLISFNRR